ncbi:MAG: hypothetical protein ACYCUY_00095 [Acidithiobacillus sp.]
MFHVDSLQTLVSVASAGIAALAAIPLAKYRINKERYETIKNRLDLFSKLLALSRDTNEKSALLIEQYFYETYRIEITNKEIEYLLSGKFSIKQVRQRVTASRYIKFDPVEKTYFIAKINRLYAKGRAADLFVYIIIYAYIFLLIYLLNNNASIGIALSTLSTAVVAYLLLKITVDIDIAFEFTSTTKPRPAKALIRWITSLSRHP